MNTFYTSKFGTIIAKNNGVRYMVYINSSMALVLHYNKQVHPLTDEECAKVYELVAQGGHVTKTFRWVGEDVKQTFEGVTEQKIQTILGNVDQVLDSVRLRIEGKLRLMVKDGILDPDELASYYLAKLLIELECENMGIHGSRVQRMQDDDEAKDIIESIRYCFD